MRMGEMERRGREKVCRESICRTVKDQMHPVKGCGEDREFLMAGFEALPFPENSLSLLFPIARSLLCVPF